MGLMTGEQYVESLRKMTNRKIYYMGQKVDNPCDHPVLNASLKCIALTYEMAHDPEYEDLLTAYSPLINDKINRFQNLHMNKEDLLKKVKMQRLLGQKTGMCFQRCAISDAANSYYATTYEIDKKYGTHYQDTFIEWFKHIQREDLFVCPGITDPKGDRSKRPAEQADPDLFFHVVERCEDGVVVNGAKMHLTSCVNAHEIFIMPTRSLKEDEKDYAIACAIPMDAEGVKMIVGRNSSDLRKLYGTDLDLGNTKYSGIEGVVIFDHVFVPNDRIFMNGETEFAGTLVDRFASYHRNSYGGCKAGVADVLIGASALMAQYNGVEKAAHIKDKLIEMTHLSECLYTGGIASSCEAYQFEAGNWMVDPMLANCCKLNVTRFPYEICRMAEEIAGGLLVTAPSGADFENPETAPYLKKLLVGANGITAENKLRCLRLIECMCLGTGAVGFRTESMNGAGSPAAQKLIIGRNANFEGKKELAKHLADIDQ